MTTTIATEAYQADTFHPARTGARTGIAAALGRMLTSLVTLQSRRADRMHRQITALNTLSDAELAQKGLRRDDIVRLVFARTFPHA